MNNAKRQKLQCPDCGSKRVFVEACVSWDENTQDWELATVHDIATCNDCSTEADYDYFMYDVSAEV